MISLHHHTNDPHVLYGIEHFIRKYGIPIRTNDKDGESKIYIIYGVENTGDFIIEIQDNEIGRGIEGWVKINNEQIPLFERPIRTESNASPLAMYHNNDESYPCAAYMSNKIVIGFDVFKEIGYILSGHLEHIYNKVDGEEKRRIVKHLPRGRKRKGLVLMSFIL